MFSAVNIRKWVVNIASFLVLLLISKSLLDYYRYQQLNETRLPEAVMAEILNQLPPVRRSQLDEGDPILVYVWATWCGYCALSSPMISDLSQEKPVVSIAMQSGRVSNVEQFMAEKNYRFPVINDPDGHLSRQIGIRLTPSFLFVNQSGEILGLKTGLNSEAELRAALALF